MSYKFHNTGTITLAQSGANNTIISAPASGYEHYIRRLVIERIDTATDVALIFLNNESPTPREILPRIMLNSDKGAVWLEFDDKTEVGVGAGKAFVIDASVANKARVTVEYRLGMATDWPS